MTIKMPHIVSRVTTTDHQRLWLEVAGSYGKWKTKLPARINAAARRQGISRTAWLHVAASKALE